MSILNTINVLMVPKQDQLGSLGEGGLKRVVQNYYSTLHKFDIRFVDKLKQADVAVIHAGFAPPPPGNIPLVSILHGMYWEGTTNGNEYLQVNATIASILRRASQVTVPSNWVAETIRRDMRVDPHVVPHGVDFQQFAGGKNSGYVLWNKNRIGDVCNTDALVYLAGRFPSQKFLSTILNDNHMTNRNIFVIGLQEHESMVEIVKNASVYLSTAKETFGIGVLEAMAAGVPVLGFAEGGNLDLVMHMGNGYLARPGNYDDLAAGLEYCLKYRNELGENARKIAAGYSWDTACGLLRAVFDAAVEPQPATVAVIIPTYNYGHKDKLGRAIDSALHQTFKPDKIVVVDDGTEDNGETRRLVESYGVEYVYQKNQGVASARNSGIASVHTRYICCLDADDAIAPLFLERCVKELEDNPSLGIAYTRLISVYPDWSGESWDWPYKHNYNMQLQGKNQVPTCNVFRRSMWERLGGYKSRYSPDGAGSEDAEFWLRAGAYGYKAELVTEEPLFLYSLLTGNTHKKGYREPNWLRWHPWIIDGQHPFISVATPVNISHPVRQYDTPSISVIIPVGDSHTQTVMDALDSLEAQTFRNWEAIVVDDTTSGGWLTNLLMAYPYIKTTSSGGLGAGAARNDGVKIARSSMLLFLDADDWLEPTAIEKMLNEWVRSGCIVYTDYYGKAFVSKNEANNLRGRLVEYNDRTREVTLRHKSFEFDKDKAVLQPNRDMYIWSLVTSLVPKVWHEQIGGFDENMQSWEDWDYWIRMARTGRNFVRIPEPLVVYRFYTGTRRESGISNHHDLFMYMRKKYGLPTDPKKIQATT